MRRALCLIAALASLTAPCLGGTIALIDASTCAEMKSHHVLNDGAPVDCERLALVTFTYAGFDGVSHSDGRIVVLDAVAPFVEHLFAALYERRFAIAKAQPMEFYEGDDNASMTDNNTSGFNHRHVSGESRLSLHAYGAAIDLNPVQNPFLTFDGAQVHVAPAAGAAYVNRARHRPGKAERQGLSEAAVEVFAQYGFTVWGGDWDDPIDYQHFDIGRALAERLAALPPEEARRAFAAHVTGYRRCIALYPDKMPSKARQICATAAAK